MNVLNLLYFFAKEKNTGNVSGKWDVDWRHAIRIEGPDFTRTNLGGLSFSCGVHHKVVSKEKRSTYLVRL
jgi:hypothetical protein